MNLFLPTSPIGPEHRRALVSFVAKRLKPGGLFFISYDCMPGWAGLATLPRRIDPSNLM